jgi:hypothetical protein
MIKTGSIAPLLLFLSTLLLIGCSSSTVESQLIGKKYDPPAIVYKPASHEVNKKAEDALRKILSSDHLASTVDALPVPFALCGPFLWQRISSHTDIAKIQAGRMKLVLPVVENGIVTNVKNLEGKILQNKSDVRTFLNVVIHDVIKGTNFTIRKLNDLEKEIYWAMISYDSIDEPIFIVQGPDYNLLVHMLQEKGLYYPFWIDDLKNVKSLRL